MENKLKLMVCPMSGNITKTRAIVRTLPKYSFIHETFYTKQYFIYLFNFAIIHAWQGHHNSITPITVGPLNIIKIQHKTEIKHNRNLEKSDIKTTLKAKGHTPAKISCLPK